MRKPALATRVSPEVNTSARKLAENLGITVSEYLRSLILQDLNSKKLLELENTNKDETEDQPRTEHAKVFDSWSPKRRRTANQSRKEFSVLDEVDER